MRAIAVVFVVPALGGALLLACPPSPVPPPAPPDASDAAPVAVADSAPAPGVTPACVAACAAMAAAGCSEGRAASCPLTMQHIDADRLIAGGNHLPITCAACASAKTPADVAALCGSSCGR